MKPAYYISVLVIAAIIIGTVFAVRSHSRNKKIHRVLTYEEPAKRTADHDIKKEDQDDAGEADLIVTDDPGVIESEINENAFPDLLKILTGTALKTSRTKQFSKRVRPKDYVFSSARMNQYVASLADDAKAQAREKRRLKILETVKPALIAFLSKNPYDGKITLNSSTIVPAKSSIAMANENILIMHTPSATKELKWSDVSPSTIAAMLQNMARIRERADRAYKQSQAEHDAQVADDYLLAAVFCDWYGNYTGAVRLVKKAVSVNPELGEFAKNIFAD